MICPGGYGHAFQNRRDLLCSLAFTASINSSTMASTLVMCLTSTVCQSTLSGTHLDDLPWSRWKDNLQTSP